MYYYKRPIKYIENKPMYYYDSYKLNQALKSIRKAVEGEKEDEIFYTYLINLAPTYEEKEIIKSIRDDEVKHNKYFKQIYKDFTGIDLKPKKGAIVKRPKSYADGIKQALFGELKAVENYRVIREAMPNRYYRDILFEIITDELKHSSKYNYLYTLNSNR